MSPERRNADTPIDRYANCNSNGTKSRRQKDNTVNAASTPARRLPPPALHSNPRLQSWPRSQNLARELFEPVEQLGTRIRKRRCTHVVHSSPVSAPIHGASGAGEGLVHTNAHGSGMGGALGRWSATRSLEWRSRQHCRIMRCNVFQMRLCGPRNGRWMLRIWERERWIMRWDEGFEVQRHGCFDLRTLSSWRFI